MSRPYTIIEAGFSRYPSVGAYERRPLMEDDVYIALDDFGSTDPANRTAQQIAGGTGFQLKIFNGLEDGSRHVVRGTVTDMPFKNDSADEVIAPHFGNPSVGGVERSIRALEIARVLRPNGLLTVVETGNYSVLTPNDLAALLKEYNFRATNSDEYDPYAIENYTGCESSVGYVATFTLAPNDHLAT